MRATPIALLIAATLSGCQLGPPGSVVGPSPDAAIPRQITFSPADDFAPAWSPDGRSIVYVSDQAGGWNLWIVDPEGRSPRALTVGNFQYSNPVFTPDGASIAVASDRGSATRVWTDLWLVDREGTQERRLVSQTPDVKEFTPTMSPNGRLLAYLDLPMTRAPQYRLVLVELPGGIPRVLTEDRVLFAPIRFSLDGAQILFTSDRGGTSDVWVIGVDGSGARALTMSPSAETAGGWSPDGSTIVFVSNQTGSDELWLMDAQGQNRRQLTYHGATASMPAFSPDGRWIAYTSTKSHNQDLWIIPTGRPPGL
jgi:Tol biopolymer transport system component